MNFILLTAIIFILAPVVPSEPCQNTSGRNRYNEFIKKHIIPPNFDTNSPEEWGKHIKELRLCDAVQSFINKTDEGKVLEICSSAGRRLRYSSCISTSTMLVYHVTSNQECKVEAKDITKSNQKVIVECNKVENQCLPVLYQKNNNESPGASACI